MKPKFDFYTKHKYGFVNPHLYFKTHMCVMKTKCDYCTKHKYGVVNPNLFFKSNIKCVFLKYVFTFWNPHAGFDTKPNLIIKTQII